ncbi:MAG: bifunctional folylpolyglutamate synthase/dihydrofolate synthase [Flavobacteriales bacterium]|nr:bifunctional folylpolyglutamate synthase/dihydrofolate synthase [Flavobacteriales bacterium]
MNYQEVLEYMFAQLPMYHRIGPAAYKPGLDNTINLLREVGDPHIGLRCVHVAGTNGKGSTSHLIASVLQEAGFKTGLYTSPHLKDFRERIRINGNMISEDDVVFFVEYYRNAWEQIKPSFFEITVALCFWYFKKEKTDFAIIETGLGGRLDSTNVIEPEISVITNIGFDHMNLLGNTIEKIASEKAGIIKKNVPVVLGKMRAEAKEVMLNKAQEECAPLIDSDLNTDALPFVPLAGLYQQENSRTAWCAIKTLQNKFGISDKNITDGFRNIVSNTNLMGRWQTLQDSPKVIADVGHNEDGIRFITSQLQATAFRHLHMVIGFAADKDLEHILSLLPKDATYYFCKANIPRGLDAKLLADEARKFNLMGDVYASVSEAFNTAKQNANPEDLVFVGGSFFTVAEVL